MLRRLAWLWLLTLAAPAAAQEAPATTPAFVLAAADLRDHVDLSGPWHWSVDPFRDGLAGFHGGVPGGSSARYADVVVAEIEARDPGALFEQDMQRAPVLSLPQSFLTHGPEMRHYQGLVWYQRSFTAAPVAGTRSFLRFGAVDYRAHVYLNGKPLGTHDGGFTPFAFEVTDLLRPGANQITVGADSQRTDADVPPPVTDWETYGGVTRPVTLLTLPQTFVDDSFVRLSRDGRIQVDVALNGPAAAGAPVRFAVPALGIRLTGTADANGRWSGNIAAPRTLRRWSPDAPMLYDVQVEAGDDRWRDRVGFRTVEVRGARILLNGAPIFLKGISLHEEEFGADPTRAITPAAAAALLRTVKDGLHGNFVRLAHYPHAEVMTRTADALGLLVWSEIPVYWRVAFEQPGTLAQARAMLAENIRRDRNRAAIALWSVANETPTNDARNAFLRTLIADVRALDDTRLVTAAMLTARSEAGGRITMRLDDPLVADLDVAAANTYNGWYGGDAVDAVGAIRWDVPADKPLIFSEFGAGARAGVHGDPARPHKFSEEYQAEYYRQTLAMARAVPSLAGMSPWVLKDFRSPRRQHPAYQQGWNRKGLMSETGVAKQAFSVLSTAYQDWPE